MCLLKIGLLACHLLGVSSQSDHSRLEESASDRFALERQLVQYRSLPCRDGRNGDRHDHSCDELAKPYSRRDED